MFLSRSDEEGTPVAVLLRDSELQESSRLSPKGCSELRRLNPAVSRVKGSGRIMGHRLAAQTHHE